MQVYIRQLKAALQGKTGDALKTPEVGFKPKQYSRRYRLSNSCCAEQDQSGGPEDHLKHQHPHQGSLSPAAIIQISRGLIIPTGGSISESKSREIQCWLSFLCFHRKQQRPHSSTVRGMFIRRSSAFHPIDSFSPNRQKRSNYKPITYGDTKKPKGPREIYAPPGGKFSEKAGSFRPGGQCVTFVGYDV